MSEHHHMDHEMDHHTHEDHMEPLNEMEPASIDHSQHSMHDHASMMNGGMSHMMSMAFHFGYEETILFDFWKISSVSGLVGSMIGIFFMAVLYEGLKYYREYMLWKTYKSIQYRSVESPANKNTVPEEDPTVQPAMLSLSHAFQTVLHILQITISYFLMLIFMIYNVWLCIAVAIGSATGYFLFGWKKSVFFDVTDHCH